MSFLLGEQRQFNSAVSATTYTFSPLATIPVGTLILLGYCSNTASTFSSCADNSTQAGTANSYSTSLGTATGTAIKGGVIWCVTTRSILSTDVVTLTLLGVASRRSGLLLTFSGQNGATPGDGSSLSTSVTASPLSFGPLGPLSGTGELVVDFSFYKGGAGLSGVALGTGTGYVLTTASAGQADATVNVETNASYKLSAGTASESATHTFSQASMTAAAGISSAWAPLPPAYNRRQIARVQRVGAGA